MARKLMLKNVSGFDEMLRKMYCEQHMTMADIGEELGCSSATVLHHIRRCGIESRKLSDYEFTEYRREIARENGRKNKGRVRSDEFRKALSDAHTGMRKRDDYEFGGHEKKRKDGYIYVYVPGHPNASSEGYVMKHRLVMERELGITIPNGYVVHHINHIRDDNRIENLALMTFEGHAGLHMKERNERRKNQ